MIIDPLIFKTIIWCLGTLIAIIGVIGSLGVKALFNMSNDIGEIKVTIKEIDTKHKGLEDRVDKIENKIFQ